MKPVKHPKKLYKKFIISNHKEQLYGCITSAGYRNKKGAKLTLKNAVGFVAKPIKGELEMCIRGYHAGTRHCFGSLNDVSAFDYVALYEVRLIGMPKKLSDGWGGNTQGAYGKYVGRSFKIVRAVYIKGQRPKRRKK